MYNDYYFNNGLINTIHEKKMVLDGKGVHVSIFNGKKQRS